MHELTVHIFVVGITVDVVTSAVDLVVSIGVNGDTGGVVVPGLV